MIEWNRFIKCPECGSKGLISCSDSFLCTYCNRQMRLKYGGSLIDLLPDRPPELTFVSSEAIKKYYYEQYKIDLFKARPKKGWGGEGGHKGYNVFIEEERNLVERFISSMGNKGLFIDLSGGSGFYTFHFAKYFKCVIHCDISIEALEYAYAESRRQHINNIYFARCDFRALSFQQGIADVVILIDSLEYYGVEEDKKVLNSAIDVLLPGGSFIFDIHLKRWFRKNRLIYEYSLKDRRQLLAAIDAKLISTHLISLGRWPMRFCVNRLLWKIANSSFFSFLPPARIVYFLTKNALFSQNQE